MESGGYLELPGKRGGRVRMRTSVSSTTVPILGRVVAGIPITAEENVEGFLPIPTSWSGGGEYFALRVFGDSMINAGILEDDHVIIRKQEIANDGDIVAVTVEGETTLKRLKQQDGRTLLVPENSDYQPIDITTASAIVHGVVIGLLRSFNQCQINMPKGNKFHSNRSWSRTTEPCIIER
jgi:repressor LexA